MSKKLTLTLWRDEIEYDVRSIMALLADAIPGDAPRHQKHLLQDVCEGENERRTWRFANSAWAALNQALQSYINVPIADESTIDNTSGTPSAYILHMVVGDEMGKHQPNAIKDAAHDFMVCTIVADWLGIVMPDYEEHWRSKAMKSMADLSKVMDSSNRIGRIKAYFDLTY